VKKEVCYRCGQELAEKRIVWLELNCVTGKWTDEKHPHPAEQSQGCFPFGVACAAKQFPANKRATRPVK
jgi:hypothetical protein